MPHLEIVPFQAVQSVNQENISNTNKTSHSVGGVGCKAKQSADELLHEQLSPENQREGTSGWRGSWWTRPERLDERQWFGGHGMASLVSTGCVCRTSCSLLCFPSYGLLLRCGTFCKDFAFPTLPSSLWPFKNDGSPATFRIAEK